MRQQILLSAIVSISMLGACKQAEQPPAADTAATAKPTAMPAETLPTVVDVTTWSGKWIGPEGMYAIITPGAGGKVSLEMQSDLDTKGTYEGTATADGISFKRGEDTLLLKKATGEETGLKYLAEKKDCLMVKTGEGYCRD